MKGLPQLGIVFSVVSLLVFSLLPQQTKAANVGYCGVVVCPVLTPPIATVALSNLDPPVAIPGPAGSLGGPNSRGTISFGPLTPIVVAESGVGPPFEQGNTANIITSYFHYQVAGASVLPLVGDVFLPVIVQGTYFLAANTANNFGVGDAGVLIKVNYSDFQPNSFTAGLSNDDCIARVGGPSCTTHGTFTMVGKIKIGVPMSIDMYAIAHSQSLVGQLGSASSFASLDPLITIDPIFADAANFSLYVSPGVGNVAAVPLPAAAGLFALQFLTLLGFRKRRGSHGVSATCKVRRRLTSTAEMERSR